MRKENTALPIWEKRVFKQKSHEEPVSKDFIKFNN